MRTEDLDPDNAIVNDKYIQGKGAAQPKGLLHIIFDVTCDGDPNWIEIPCLPARCVSGTLHYDKHPETGELSNPIAAIGITLNEEIGIYAPYNAVGCREMAKAFTAMADELDAFEEGCNVQRN